MSMMRGDAYKTNFMTTIIGVSAIFVSYSLSLFRVNDPYFISGLVLSIYIVCELRRKILRYSVIDVILLVIWLFNILNLFLSVSYANSFMKFRLLTLGILFYYSLRLYLGSGYGTRRFLMAVTYVIAALSILAIVTFCLYKSGAEYAGFNNLYEIRYKFSPLGYLPNVWGNLQLVFIVILLLAALYNRHYTINTIVIFSVMALTVFNAAITFSRGMYICILLELVLFVLLSLLSGFSVRYKMALLCSSILPVVVCSCCFPLEVAQVARFNDSVSQQRSVESRLEGINASINAFSDKPVFGYGNGNYSLAVNDQRYEKDTEFSDFAPNIYVQVLVEQGVVGVLLFMALLGTIIVVFVKKLLGNSKNKLRYCTVAGVFMIILVRESFFTSFSSSVGYQMSFMLMLSIFVDIDSRKRLVISRRYVWILSVALSILYFYTIGTSLVYFKSHLNNIESIASFKEGNAEEAISYMEKTPETFPYIVNRTLLYIRLSESLNDTSLLEKADEILNSIKDYTYDPMAIYYEGLIQEAKGQNEMALQTYKSLNTAYPEKCLYSLAVFKMLYRQGKYQESVPYLVSSVKLSPNILTNRQLQILLNSDSTACNFIRTSVETLLKQEAVDADDIISKARYARAMMILEYQDMAEEMLKDVTERMPGLSMPWYYLSCIERDRENFGQSRETLKKFVFLRFTAYRKESIDKIIMNKTYEQVLSNDSGISDNYPLKFETWYRETLFK